MFNSGSMFSQLISAILLLTTVNLTLSGDYYEYEGPSGPDTYQAYYGADYVMHDPPYDCNEEMCSVVSEDMTPVSELYTVAIIGQNEDKPYECRTGMYSDVLYTVIGFF